MQAAAGFVELGSADNNDRVVIVGRFAVDEALGAAGGFTANHADGIELVHAFGLSHECGHAAKGFAAKIGIEPGNQDADAAVGQFLHYADNFVIEELGFIDPYDGGFGFDVGEDIGGPLNGQGVELAAGMGGDFFYMITVINDGFENLDILPGDGSPAQPADQFIGFATKHRAGNDFNRSCMVLHESRS